MAFIKLAVTSKVIRQAGSGGVNQRQIAIKDASLDLQEKIGTARKNNRLLITISAGIELVLGDTGAIWNTHQKTPAQKAAFTDLYERLAKQPDQVEQFDSN